MANVNAQSVEDLPDRTIYRFAAGRFEQVATSAGNVFSPGLKTCVNTQASISYIVPASGISARLYKIEWNLKMVVQSFNAVNSTNTLNSIDFLRMSATSLNYDGKNQQTEFYENKTENYYTSPQLRSINIGNISVETKPSLSNYLYSPQIDIFNSYATNFIIALFQPTVTFYKK